jgi:hypothetical protein
VLTRANTWPVHDCPYPPYQQPNHTRKSSTRRHPHRRYTHRCRGPYKRGWCEFLMARVTADASLPRHMLSQPRPDGTARTAGHAVAASTVRDPPPGLQGRSGVTLGIARFFDKRTWSWVGSRPEMMVSDSVGTPQGGVLGQGSDVWNLSPVVTHVMPRLLTSRNYLARPLMRLRAAVNE